MSTQSTNPPQKRLSKFWHKILTSVAQWIESWKPSPTKSPAEVATDVVKKALLVGAIVVSPNVPAFFGEIFEWGIISGFWRFFWDTVPLIISLAIIIPFTVIYFTSSDNKRREHDFQSNYSRNATWALVVVVILWTTVWISGNLGLGAAQSVQQRATEAEDAHAEACIGHFIPGPTIPGPNGTMLTRPDRYIPPSVSCRYDWLSMPFRYVGNYAFAYFEVYGPWTSFCCLIVALFIDWIIIVMLPPLLNRRRQR
jgi:hypothetical protein